MAFLYAKTDYVKLWFYTNDGVYLEDRMGVGRDYI